MKGRPRSVFIEWEDSMARGGWCREVPEDGTTVHSVAWLVEEREKSIIVTTSHTVEAKHGDDYAIMDPLEIPRCAIKRIQELVALEAPTE